MMLHGEKHKTSCIPIPSARGFVVYADGVNLALLPVPTHFISVFETAISGYWIVYQR